MTCLVALVGSQTIWQTIYNSIILSTTSAVITKTQILFQNKDGYISCNDGELT